MRNFNKDNNNDTKPNDNMMKRPLTLDLNKKIVNSNGGPPILSTPDVNLCKLGSPELENFILNTDTLQTPTPSAIFPTAKITSAQEDYAKGFEDALKTLHNNDTISKPVTSNITSTNTMSGGGITYADAENANLLMQIKEEPQSQNIQPSSPQMSPIDMESQERIKLERKRQRNRVAASKCRKRKLERISKLEDRVKVLKVENHDLGSVLLNLKQHVFDLKQQVINHHNSGCHISIKN
ncbi:CLUMA_CG014887, isoform A [Clunio marinus]|uniref:CLUMA_CG014887, isoform A n=1 Tax=Clunio marinus TaxID=568069 RepID=A0A1J1IN70_9DIPT|nr:CLUMA_CG014887, isoform A [Clunio marinus]